MSFLDFVGFSDPSKSAMPYLHRAEETQKQYYEPYIDIGQKAGGIYGDISQRYAQDPAAVLDELMAKYQPSKAYQFQQERMGQAAANTAAAGGYRGSPREQTAQQEITQGLLSKDMQDFLSNVLGIQKTGLQGEENLFKTGYGASSSLADNLSNILSSEGSLAFQGEREKSARLQSILKLLTQLGGIGLGGGLGGKEGALSVLQGFSGVGGGK